MTINIKTNDKVKLIAGKEKGKIGKVLKILKNKNKVLVEGINMVKRHSKPTAQNTQGGIVEKEAALNISNVMLMCNACIKPARVKVKILEDGKKARICKKCNESIGV